MFDKKIFSLLFFLGSLTINREARGNEMEGGPIMTAKVVAFSFQVSAQEKLILDKGEAITLNPHLTRKQLRTLLDQLLKKAIDYPTSENVRQYILTQHALKRTEEIDNKREGFPIFSNKRQSFLLSSLNFLFTFFNPVYCRPSQANLNNFTIQGKYLPLPYFLHAVWM